MRRDQIRTRRSWPANEGNDQWAEWSAIEGRERTDSNKLILPRGEADVDGERIEVPFQLKVGLGLP